MATVPLPVDPNAAKSRIAELDKSIAAMKAVQAPAADTRVVTGTPADAATFGQKFQTRFDASQAAGSRLSGLATPAPMTQQTGFALGNAIRADNIAAAKSAALRPAQNPSMAGAQANAAAGQTALAGRIQDQQDTAAAYQKNVGDAAALRQKNVLAAKALPDSDPNSFKSIQDRFHAQHGTTSHMDDSGNIVHYDDATKQKMIASQAASKLAADKHAFTTSKATNDFHASKLKELLGEQKAAEAAKAGSPQEVSKNIAGLFGATPAPTFTPAPSLEPFSALSGIRQADVAAPAPATVPAPNAIFNPQTGGPLRNTLRAGARVASLLPNAAGQLFESTRKSMDRPFESKRLP